MGRVTRDGAALELRPQAFQVLRTLLSHSGRHVDYDLMIHQAWEGNIVSRHTVAVTVGEVKKALGEYGGWITYRPKLGYRLEVPKSEDLIRKGWHFWNRQNREGLEKALCAFEKAARQDGADFRAYEGIAASYLKLGTYGMRCPGEMYPRFLEAHRRAVELGGLTPELRTDRAIGLHVFERDLAGAEAELLQARRERPQLAKVFASLIVVYVLAGRYDEALKVMVESQDSHELWPTFPAAEALIKLCQRQFDAAVALGNQAVELHPFMPLSRVFYAQALEYSGRSDEALEQYHLAWVVSGGPAWVRALEGACLAREGQTEQALGILDGLEQLRATEYVDAYHMALLREALGHREEAFRELARACDENSASLCLMDADPKVDTLRSDPRFESLRNRAFPLPRSAGPNGNAAPPPRLVAVPLLADPQS
ncbi:MAG: winged helix-turn-helix domain-containing protein [Acidobacteriia bacterium]|nr:winged helix-turn-helix domain-containing protein [Terriglobia bacterium]